MEVLCGAAWCGWRVAEFELLAAFKSRIHEDGTSVLSPCGDAGRMNMTEAVVAAES